MPRPSDAQAQRRGEAALGFVPDGVIGAADALHLLQAKAGLIDHLPGGAGERLAQQPMHQAHLLEPDRRRRADAFDQVAQVARVGLVQRVQQAHAQLQPGTFEFQKGRVHARCVAAGADADNPAGGHEKVVSDQWLVVSEDRVSCGREERVCADATRGLP
jgi:hypothetical protein